MIYVDTSVLVALIVNEPHSEAVARWYANTKDELVSAAWCVTEFASALGIKQRTKQIDQDQAKAAWERFGRLVANDLQLLPVDPAHFHRAAGLTLDPSSSLRAGDSLHLACAEHAGVKSMATLDDVLGRNAQKLKIKPVVFA
jgi:predicted nucleic acid-binding protein